MVLVDTPILQECEREKCEKKSLKKNAIEGFRGVTNWGSRGFRELVF
jgi:hypothetical protein